MTRHSIRMPDELRVLIVGGGIAGLTLAALMRQRGMRAELVEKTHGYGGVGYVLALWPAGSDVLKGLGLYPTLAEASARAESFEILDGRGAPMNVSHFDRVEDRFGTTCWSSGRGSSTRCDRASIDARSAWARRSRGSRTRTTG